MQIEHADSSSPTREARLKNLGREVAKGAAWMVGLRLLQRSLGLISTVVLARLLVPADFGLVAMALSVAGLVELITLLGFDLALIRKTDATRAHYDAAWTLGIMFRTIAALCLAASAPAVAAFFSDERLVNIIYVYAFVSLVSGFENIGVVAFRKELKFNQEFKFQLIKKLLAVIATVAMAVYFKSYWALVLGTLFSQIIGVGLSYWIHSYRPRLDVSVWRELLGFSAWVVFNNLMLYVRKRGTDFIIGPMLGAQALGGYRVAKEIASLPTTELTMPIMRSVFPGFAKIKDDPARLREAYLLAQGAVVTATLPICVALLLLVEQCVFILLGPKWMSIAELVQISTLYGVLKILQGNSQSLFMAAGRPYWVGVIVAVEVVIFLPLTYFLIKSGGGIEMAAWAAVIGSIVIAPFVQFLISRILGLRRFEFFRVLLRPSLSAVLMSLALWTLQTYFPPVDGLIRALWTLLISLLVGGLVYMLSLTLLWILSGRPDGIERRVLEVKAVRSAFRYMGVDLLK